MRPLPLRPRSSLLAIAAALALVAGGCATPALHPAVEVPGRFAQAAPTAASEDESDAAWWDSFGDPVLSSLIRKAALENRDVKIAAERVRAARAGETISRSRLYPSVGVGVGGLDLRNGYDGLTQQFVPDAKAGGGGLAASWEVDLFGRLRAGAAAANAEAMAQADAARGVRLLVMTDVASHYFRLAGALRQLETVRAISAAQDETLRLVKARERVGLATSFDVERAQSDASRARAAIPPLETLAAVSRHRIAVLIGDQAFNASGIATYAGAAVVPPTRAGQPATLLQRRPDVLAAKAQLEAANARRQQAAAEWFPRLLLGAAFGRGSIDVNDVAMGTSRFTNAAALLAMPIFNAGRTQAINDVAESAQREALIRYESAMVSALEDVENALVALGAERRRAQSLHASADAAVAALGHARSLYRRGQVDLLPLLDAQRAELAARRSANDSDTQLLLDSVQLYKALGGGWEVFETNSGSKDVRNQS